MDEKLWGMPFEVAAGVIGLGGALIGAFIAAASTIWVARWQARQQLLAVREERLDPLIAQLLSLAEDAQEFALPGHPHVTTELAERLSEAVPEAARRAHSVSHNLAKVIEDADAALKVLGADPRSDDGADAFGNLVRDEVWASDLWRTLSALVNALDFWVRDAGEFRKRGWPFSRWIAEVAD